MGAFIGWLAGLVVALLIGWFAWLPLYDSGSLGDNLLVTGLLGFVTGFICSGIGFAIGGGFDY